MRFLHTSDWQLGLKLNFVPGDAGARLRFQRFDTVRRIAQLARDRTVDAVVVAGDVFDDNGVGLDTLQLARDALATFAPIPVLLLPGNHDAATPDSALARLRAGGHVRVLDGTEPVSVAGGFFYSCPLRRRHSMDDPTGDLPPRSPGDRTPRVAVAHGGVLDFGETTETPNRIDVQGVLAKGFDYVALGDWHGTLRFHERAWYPGTPEPTRFTERAPGNVLVVDVREDGERPEVEVVAVARASWITRDAAFHSDEDIRTLGGWLESLPEPSWTLVRLTLAGQLSLSARAALDLVVQRASSRFLHIEVARDDVVDAPSDEDLQVLRAEGFLGLAVDALRAEESAEARDALRLLHRFLLEEGS